MILEQIKNPDFFNNSEQNMIYFLQNNLNSFDQVTLNKMAKESFSSTSSVLRFCKKLGFDIVWNYISIQKTKKDLEKIPQILW